MRPPDNPYTSPSEETAWKVVKVFFVVVAIATVAGSFPRDLTGRNAVPSESLVVPAEVRPGRLETIAAKYAGRVMAVNAIVGQLVEANQVLMVLGSDELETAERAAVMRVKLAGERLATSRAAATNRLRRGQAQAAEAELAAAKRRQSAFSSAGAEDAARQARADTARLEDLVKRRLATAVELEAARDRERSAEQARTGAAAQAERLRDEVQSYERQLGLIRLGADVDPTSRAIDNLNEQEARSALATVRKAKAGLNVLAPFRGVVLAGIAAVGDEVSAGATLAQIGDLKNLEFRAVVPGNVAGSLAAGIPVRIRVPSDPPQWVVAAIHDVDSAPNLALGGYRVRVLPPPGSVKPDALASFQGAIELPRAEEKWRLPF